MRWRLSRAIGSLRSASDLMDRSLDLSERGMHINRIQCRGRDVLRDYLPSPAREGQRKMHPSDFAAPRENRYFEDYVVGSVHEYGPIAVTEEEMIAFATRYDPQIFHVDPEAAKKTRFGGLIASGWLTAGLAMRLWVENVLSSVASQGSPGVNKLRWIQPVYPGDELSLPCENTGRKALPVEAGLGGRRFFYRGEEPERRSGHDPANSRVVSSQGKDIRNSRTHRPPGMSFRRSNVLLTSRRNRFSLCGCIFFSAA